jgi:hypothetical protein
MEIKNKKRIELDLDELICYAYGYGCSDDYSTCSEAMKGEMQKYLDILFSGQYLVSSLPCYGVSKDEDAWCAFVIDRGNNDKL